MLQRAGEAAVLVEHVGDAAAHPGGEVAPGAAEHDDVAAGHVLAAVVADALDDGVGARVAHGEPLAGEPAEERLAPGRAVEDGVADDHVLLRGEGRALGRPDRDRAAREPLAGVVVRVAVERQLDPGREPRAERLAGRAAQREADRLRRQALDAVRFVTALESSPPTVRLTLRTAHLGLDRRPSSIAGRASSISSQSSAPGSGESWRVRAAQRCARRERRAARSRFERSTPRAFQWSIASSASSRSTRPIRSSKRAIPSRAIICAHLLGDEEEEVDDVLGRAREARAQLRILGRDSDRAGVQVAGAHHHAAGRDERSSREAHLVGAEQRRDRDVASGLQLPVGLHPDPRAEVVEDERLLGLGEADLPRDAGALDRRERRGAGAAVVAGDQHVVGVALRDPAATVPTPTSATSLTETCASGFAQRRS